MSRPQNAADVAQINRTNPDLSQGDQSRIAQLAAFVEDEPGVEADYQLGSAAPRPSFSVKLANVSIWNLGYRFLAPIPALQVLPGKSWQDLPTAVTDAFLEGLAARGLLLSAGDSVPLDELTERELNGVREATRAAVRVLAALP